MAQKFSSPGVFATEVDQSFLAQGVVDVGAAVVGGTDKGPAFVPMLTTGLDSFASLFGEPKPGRQLAYAAKYYLRNSSALTVVRVLGHDDGTSTTNGYILPEISAIADSGSSASALAVVHHSGALTVTGVALDANNFVVTVGSIFATTASFLTSSANYVEKVLNTDPTLFSTYGHYLYRTFKYAQPVASASWGTVGISGSTTSYERNFEGASSTWVKSQPVGGQEYNLFRFHTLGHGRAANEDVKVMIANVKPSSSPLATPYGTFDVVVRSFSDTDQKTVALETFVGCTLDPDSNTYLPLVIGDKYEEFDTSQRKFVSFGENESRSSFVRVELDVDSIKPPEALPWGHRGYTKETWSGSLATVPSFTYTQNQYDRAGNLEPSINWGISFVSGGVADRLKAFPNSAVLSADTEFSMAFLSASYVNGRQSWSYVPSLPSTQYHQPVFASASLYKFVLPFQGGFDGFDLRVEDSLYLTNGADDTDIGVVSLKRALDSISNPDAFDMNILAVPGVHNIRVADRARQIVNDRGDVIYIMDVTGSSVPEAVGLLKSREIDDNYTATYYPDVKIKDKTNKKILRLSPSAVVLGAYSYSDRVGQVFFAPAGLNRGGLGQFDVVDTADRLNHQDRNDLYDNRINPIASFPREGIVVFGQKTLQVRASALDRVNVRRLLIFAKKTVVRASRNLLFEPNNPETWQRFTNVVNPILEDVRQNQGLNRFKVVMDSTTNTNDLIDRNIMTGKIFLEPTKSTEFIDLSFVITAAGVEFGE